MSEPLGLRVLATNDLRFFVCDECRELAGSVETCGLVHAERCRVCGRERECQRVNAKAARRAHLALREKMRKELEAR